MFGEFGLTECTDAQTTNHRIDPAPAPLATMFARSLKSMVTPPCSFSARPLPSVLNCTRSPFLSLRPFSQSSAAMASQVFFDVEYEPQNAQGTSTYTLTPRFTPRSRSFARATDYTRPSVLLFNANCPIIHPIPLQ